MSNLPFLGSTLDAPYQKCLNYSQDCIEPSESVLTGLSSFTYTDQMLDQQEIFENFRDINVSLLPSLCCDPSKLGDVIKDIAQESFEIQAAELPNGWKSAQEKSENFTTGSKNYVPESAHFLKDLQEALCDKDEEVRDCHQNNFGVKSVEPLSVNSTPDVMIENDGVEFASTDIKKLETSEGLYFCCSLCYASFESLSNAMVHLQEHGITKPYKCVLCENSSHTEIEAKAHYQSHVQIEQLSCKGRQHFSNDKMHRPEAECGLSNPVLERVENSGTSEDSDDEDFEPAANQNKDSELYACDECSRSFPIYEELMKHKETDHFGGNEEFDFEDTYSSPPRVNLSEDIVLNNVPMLNENDPPKQMKTGKKNSKKTQRNFACSTCGKSFRASKPLREHEVVHTGAKDFACEICGKAFGTRANMKIHLATHSDKRPFFCTICNATFRQKDSLKVHLRKHSGERPFACTVCNMRFDRNFTLKNHLLTHGEEKSYVCVVCGKAFTTRGGLNNHERLHSKDPTKKKARKPPSKPGTGNWICDECGKLYSTRSNLKMHQRSHEPTTVTHTCYVCGRVYKHKDSLEVHMRRHTDDRPYRCPTCGRTFYRNWTLKLHMLTHTGEKPHKCPVEECDKAFTQSSSLYNHVQNYHKESDSTDGNSVQEGTLCRENGNINQSEPIMTNPIQNPDLPNGHLDVAPLFTPALPNSVDNLILPVSLEDSLSSALSGDLAVKIGVEEIIPSVLSGLDLSAVAPDVSLVERVGAVSQNTNLVPDMGVPNMCHSDVSANLAWDSSVLPMGMSNITNIHLPQDQLQLPPLPQPMDPLYMLQDNLPLLVNVSEQLYQHDSIKMALPNFASQLR